MGFTLTELLAVLAILAVITASFPTLSGALQGSSLNNASRLSMNLLTQARTHAITSRELVRFAVATNWQDTSSADYRKVSLWASPTGDAGSWRQITRWEQLPVGILFDPSAAGYIDSTSRPAVDCLFSKPSDPDFSASIGSKNVTMQFVEFLPSGAIRMNGGNGYEIWFALATENNQAAGASRNWAVLSANIYTGRFRCSRPGS